MSVDPLAEKYPGINPYTYVANNPINAIDPDGRDFRMVTQRNSSGKIVNVSLHATIYLQGNGSSQNLAGNLNNSFNNDYSTSRNINGVNVSFNLTFIHDGKGVKNSGNLSSGENVLNVRTDMPSSQASFVNGLYDGSSGTISVGNTGGINSKSSDIINTTIHEGMHFLGISDRYDDFTGDNANMGSAKQTHPGFRNDIMGGGKDFSDVHFENALDFSQNNSDSKSSSKNGFNYSGNLNMFYDRKSKSILLNGGNPPTNYHERSKQAN